MKTSNNCLILPVTFIEFKKRKICIILMNEIFICMKTVLCVNTSLLNSNKKLYQPISPFWVIDLQEKLGI